MTLDFTSILHMSEGSSQTSICSRDYELGSPRWTRNPSVTMRWSLHSKWIAPRCQVRRSGIPDRSSGVRASFVPGAGILWLTMTIRGLAPE
jgi:hypothetical protein